MRIDATEARAARNAARREPIEYVIGDTTITFKPEMSLDIMFGVEKAYVSDLRGLRLWMLAHMQVDADCDTSCVDGKEPKVCKTHALLGDRLRKVRVDGEPLNESDIEAMWDEVRDAQGMTEGESSSSAESSETAGDTSSGTSSDTGSTPTRSGRTGKAVSAA